MRRRYSLNPIKYQEIEGRIVNCNPDGPYHYFKTEWIDKKDQKNLIHLHFTMDDNLSLTERIKNRYRNMYSGVFYQRYILGLWTVAEGVIFDMFDGAKHVVDGVLDLVTTQTYVSIDYGTQNATVFLLWQKGKDNKWYCVKEYFYSGRESKKQKTDTEYADDLEAFTKGIRIKEVIVDPSAASFIAELKTRNFKIRKAKNDVLDGIRFVGTMLNEEKIAFYSDCTNTIKEFSSYIWDEKAVKRGEDKPIKDHDHCLTGDTIVNTTHGDFKIEDLVGIEGKVHAFNRWTGKPTVSKFFDVHKTQKNVEVFEVELEDGRTFKGTGNHKVLTQRGWVIIDDLTGRDSILDISDAVCDNQVKEREQNAS